MNINKQFDRLEQRIALRAREQQKEATRNLALEVATIRTVMASRFAMLALDHSPNLAINLMFVTAAITERQIFDRIVSSRTFMPGQDFRSAQIVGGGGGGGSGRTVVINPPSKAVRKQIEQGLDRGWMASAEANAMYLVGAHDE